jgi:hypothetical protein
LDNRTFALLRGRDLEVLITSVLPDNSVLVAATKAAKEAKRCASFIYEGPNVFLVFLSC